MAYKKCENYYNLVKGFRLNSSFNVRNKIKRIAITEFFLTLKSKFINSYEMR